MNVLDLGTREQKLYLQLMAKATDLERHLQILQEIRESALAVAPEVAERTATKAAGLPMTAGISDLASQLIAAANFYFQNLLLDQKHLWAMVTWGRAMTKLGLTPSGIIVVGQIWLLEWSQALKEITNYHLDQSRKYLVCMNTVQRFHQAVFFDVLVETATEQVYQEQNQLLDNFLAATGLSRELYEQMARAAQTS